MVRGTFSEAPNVVDIPMPLGHTGEEGVIGQGDVSFQRIHKDFNNKAAEAGTNQDPDLHQKYKKLVSEGTKIGSKNSTICIIRLCSLVPLYLQPKEDRFSPKPSESYEWESSSLPLTYQHRPQLQTMAPKPSYSKYPNCWHASYSF